LRRTLEPVFAAQRERFGLPAETPAKDVDD